MKRNCGMGYKKLIQPDPSLLHETDSTGSSNPPLSNTKPSAPSTAATTSDVCKKFKKLLDSKVMQQYGTKDDLLVKRNIQIAPLQISTQQQNVKLADDHGHFHRRKELSNVFNEPQTGNDQYTELFNVARAEAQRKSKIYCNNVAAKCQYQMRHGNIIGVTGQAGIGKTTLTKTLACKILEEKLYDVDYVFYLKFCDIDYGKVSSVLDFLVNDSLIHQGFNKDELQNLLKFIDCSDTVCIILDGFDEASVSKMSKPFRKKCSIYDKANPETFIKNLLSRNIFPNAKLLVTSRPRQLLKLHKDYKPQFVVNILGLDDAGQKQICGDICSGEKVQSEKLSQFIADRIDLKRYCYVPINCILVMHCVFLSFQTSDLININSMTTILVATLKLFIDNGHLQGEEFQIKNLCNLAYNGFVSNRLYFEKKHIKNAKVSIKTATTFLTTTMTEKVSLTLSEGLASSRSYFSHLILQEFFVALYLLFFVSVNEFKKLSKSLTSSKYEMITKFIFGLCNSATLMYLERLMPSDFVVDKACVDAKSNHLQIVVRKALDKQFRKKDFDLLSFLRLSAWVYELREEKFAHVVSNRLQQDISLEGNILPSDIPAFHYLLRARDSLLRIQTFQPQGFVHASQQFYSELNKTLQLQTVQIEKLFVQNLNQDDEVYDAIAQCLKDVRQLQMGDSVNHIDVSSSGMRLICKAIQELTTPMKYLKFYGKMFDDDVLIAISSCLNNIEEIYVDEICLQTSHHGINALAEAMKKRNHPYGNLKIKKLFVEKSKQDDEVYEVIAQCVKHVRQLQMGIPLNLIDVSSSGMRLICKAIQELTTPMEELALWGEIFDDDVLIAISSCVNNIETLVIGNNSLPTPFRGINALAEAITRRKHPMKTLTLVGKLFDDDVLIVLSSCVNNIEKLHIGKIRSPTPYRGINALAEAITRRKHPMIELFVQRDQSSKDETRKILCRCGYKITKLKVW